MVVQPKKESSFPAPIEREQFAPIIQAISKLDHDDLETYGAWSDLDALSSHTLFEGIEPHPDGIFRTGKDTFEAVATVYVMLQYGDKRDKSVMSDSYPARVVGTIGPNNEIKIDVVKVDTRSFYE